MFFQLIWLALLQGLLRVSSGFCCQIEGGEKSTESAERNDGKKKGKKAEPARHGEGDRVMKLSERHVVSCRLSSAGQNLSMVCVCIYLSEEGSERQCERERGIMTNSQIRQIH